MSKEHKLADIQTTLPFERGAVSLFKQWLYENYKVRVNSLDIEDVYLEATDANPQKYEFAVTENDIYLHALEDGLKVSRSLINSIIASPNHSEHYNPITEYLEERKGKYQGTSQLDYLINCLHMGIDEDKEKKAYIIKKWFVATAACALGKKANDVALGIISDRAGIGKTTFFTEIIPAPLRKYIQTVLKRSSNQLPESLFANKLLLNFDELAALNNTTESQFKELMSAETIISRVPGTRRSTQSKRIASVCFTSNKTTEQGGFIRSNDPGILRRLAIVEVDSIEDYRITLDVDMLWSEVVTLLMGGYDYIWNRDDFEYLTLNNKKYIVSTNAMRVVRQHLSVPTKADKLTYMTSRDLMAIMRKKHWIPSSMTNVDEISVGQALSSLGFRRVIKRLPGVGPRYCYEIRAADIE